MALISPAFLILGLVVALVTASESSTSSTTLKGDNITMTLTPSNFTSVSSNISTSTVSITTSNSINTTHVIKKGGGNTTDGKAPRTTMPTITNQTPKPGVDKKPTVPTTTGNQGDIGKTTLAPDASTGDSTGIVILIVIIIVALGCGIACFFARNRGRRYSVDLTSRPDEANIPLSIVEPELPINAVPQNGLQTFESLEAPTKESQESEMKPKVQEEQRADADKSVVEPSTDPAAPAPSPDSSENKPKGDVVEPSPPAPVEPSADEKTDDEGAISNKTSVESLKETNNNNSNNADLSQKTDLMSSSNFWDVPLDCPV